ncbi:MAG: hypothetical protein JWR51_536 [Devosia sp.]|uniref:succinylglutamate desuccinylase/aspartoacylase family protein n=1 Tax=Devosia sp. TaxID=1871048 RepID=UPI00261DA8E3|nr:succinylglutamate desuccinylase/aspartoacylase family protein [Devosia sp.]MDB5527433.1 hypothetical protein [Devosia sp.]
MEIEVISATAGAAVTAALPGTLVRRSVQYATGADGVEQTFPLIVLQGVSAGPTVVLVAGIHGDEYEGPSALRQLSERIDPTTLAGRVLIVPIANLPAFAAGTRTSPIDNENLARIFPGDPNGTLSHRLAAALMTTVIDQADILIDSHSGGVRLAFVPVAGFYDSGDVTPATAAKSLQIARQMGIAFLWRLPPVRGVLSYEAAKRGIAVCGAEIGGRGNCLARDAADYLGAYLSVLASQDMIDPAHKRPETSVCLDGDWEKTPRGGYLQTVVALGERVEAGQPLARLYSPMGELLQDFRAAFDGRVMAVRHLNSVQAGDLATCVVKETTL